MRAACRWTLASAALLGLWSASASAHCDGMDGPVVTAARAALAQNDATLVLIWVPKEDEGKIRDAFAQTRAVRKLGPQARDLADRYFFETLVRLHRAAEGAPFTGLKPAGRDLGPAIPAVDRALESGDVGPLVRLLRDATEKGVRERFADVRAARDYRPGDVVAGRAYVEKYVPFVHYVERLHRAATTSVAGHEAESAADAHAEE